MSRYKESMKESVLIEEKNGKKNLYVKRMKTVRESEIKKKVM